MAYFAKIENGIVTQVIVAEADFFDTFVDTTPGDWVQTSYNTYKGVHNSGGTALRKNFASIGHIYDFERDAFYAPQPFPSWVLNETTCQWEAPVPYPVADSDEQYEWNEENQTWDEI